MSDANMVATSTKQLIISIVIVAVMLATANQIGQNFLSSSFNARIDSLEKNFEARFVRIEGDIRELRRGQEALNLRFSALTERVARIEERVARIESFLFDSPEKLARAEQTPLKSEADGVQIAP